MAKLAAGLSQDAGYSYIWDGMDHDTRAMVCLLVDLSSEAAYADWVQLPTVERVALRSGLSRVIADHWEREKKLRPAQYALSELGA